jgi:hypothetical protein
MWVRANMSPLAILPFRFSLCSCGPERYDTRFTRVVPYANAVIATFEDLLYRYMWHLEAKNLAPDGGPCKGDTRGLLQRTHIVAGKFHRIGKEGDQRWEEGDDLESIRFESTDYDRDEVSTEATAKTKESLVRKIKKIGVKELVRFGCGERILKKICRRELVRTDTLNEYERKVDEYAL